MLERAQPPIGIVSIGTYTPSQFMTAAEVARITGLPEQVITEKLGIRRKPIPGPDDHPNAMGIAISVVPTTRQYSRLPRASCWPIQR